MSNKKFSIKKLCASKGIYLNQLKQKYVDQFSQGVLQKNFCNSFTCKKI